MQAGRTASYGQTTLSDNATWFVQINTGKLGWLVKKWPLGAGRWMLEGK